MATIEYVKRKHTARRARVVSGTVESCCHRIEFYYDVPGARISDSDLAEMQAEAESRADEMIPQGYRSGDLCCLITTSGREREFFGWWSIA